MKGRLAIESKDLDPRVLELPRPFARPIETADRNSKRSQRAFREFHDQPLRTAGFQTERHVHDVRLHAARFLGNWHQAHMISLGKVLSLAGSSASVKSPIAHDGTRSQRLLAVSSEMPWPLDT